MEKPELSQNNGFVSLDLVVNLTYGIAARSACRIYNECEDYGREVYFARKNQPEEKKKTKDLLGLLALCVSRGTEITIEVKGEDKTAVNLALRLYSALTSKDSYDMDFGRFENLEIGQYDIPKACDEGKLDSLVSEIIGNKDTEYFLQELFSDFPDGNGIVCNLADHLMNDEDLLKKTLKTIISAAYHTKSPCDAKKVAELATKYSGRALEMAMAVIRNACYSGKERNLVKQRIEILDKAKVHEAVTKYKDEELEAFLIAIVGAIYQDRYVLPVIKAIELFEKPDSRIEANSQKIPDEK